MNVSEICTRKVVVIPESMPLNEAARMMREHHVGCLVVVKEEDKQQIPVGLLTDRDIVVEAVAMELDTKTVLAGEAMSRALILAMESDSVTKALRLMRDHGIRRLPVVSSNGALTGVVTLDDIIGSVSNELSDMNRLIMWERNREGGFRPSFSPHTTS